MYNGINLMCLAPVKAPPYRCLTPLIVPAEKYLKIANTPFKCPACDYKNPGVKPFFRQVMSLQKVVKEFENTGFEVTYIVSAYHLHYFGCDVSFDEQDQTTTPPACFLNDNDWWDWNLQIAYIRIQCIQDPTLKEVFWEDRYFSTRPCFIPGQTALTFDWVLTLDNFHVGDREIKNLHILKALIKEIRNYNTAWVSALDAQANAALIHLPDPESFDPNGPYMTPNIHQDVYE